MAEQTARAKGPRKVIITCAVTGSIHTPSMSPHLPMTAEQIADAAIGAAEAGAAIIHLHARNPQSGILWIDAVTNQLVAHLLLGEHRADALDLRHPLGQLHGVFGADDCAGSRLQQAQ